MSEQQQQQQQTDHATTSPDPVQTGDHSEPLEEQQEDKVNPSGPEFKPFFTLIEDANSSEYYHPTVHYIFSDDDPELITEAALRALETGNEPSGRYHREQGEHGYVEEGSEAEPSGSRKQSLLPPPIPGVKERYIILDVEPYAPQQDSHGASSAPDTATQIATAAGATSMSTSPAQQQHQQQQQSSAPQQAGPAFRITSAHSLTPDWQVLNTQISPAPSFDTFNNHHTGEPSSPPSSSGTLMLKIEGTSGPRDIVPARGDDHKDQTLEEMMEQFEKRMGELRRVIEAGGNYPLKRPELNRAGDTEDTANSGDKDEGQAQDRTAEHGSGESHRNPEQEE